jgi:hypothetical protein
MTVTNLNDSGPGSLRQAVGLVANGGTDHLRTRPGRRHHPLTSGPLVIPPGRHVTIDAAARPAWR